MCRDRGLRGKRMFTRNVGSPLLLSTGVRARTPGAVNPARTLESNGASRLFSPEWPGRPWGTARPTSPPEPRGACGRGPPPVILSWSSSCALLRAPACTGAPPPARCPPSTLCSLRARPTEGSPGCAVGSRHGRVRCVPSSPPLHRCGNCALHPDRHPTPRLSQLRKPQGRWQRAQGGGRGGPGLGGLVVGRECAQRSQPLPRGLPPTEVGLRTPGSYTVSL